MKVVLLAMLSVSLGIHAEEICEINPPADIRDLNDVVRCENLGRGLEKEGNLDLYKNLVRGKAALDNCDEDEIKKGVVKFPHQSTRYFESMKIDCKREFDNVKFALSNASMLISSDKPDLKSLFGTLTNTEKYKQQMSFQSKKMKSVAETRALFDSVGKELCFDHLEKKKDDEATLSDCSAELADFKLPEPQLDCKGKAVKGVTTLLAMEKTIRSQASCKERLEKISQLFSAKVNNLDDLMVLKYVSKNFKTLVKSPKTRQIIGSSLYAATPVPLGAAEEVAEPFRILDFTSDLQNFNSSAIDLRLGMISVQNKAFKKHGLSKYANFCQSQNKDAILNDSLEAYTEILKAPESARKESTEFSAKCDKKIATIFGDSNTVASTCGHDHLGTNGGQDRAHTFMNAHFYPNHKGSGTGPLYAPKGMTSMKLIPGMASQGCYKLLYGKGIGDLKGSYTIDFCHTGNPATGRNVASLPKNEKGSSLIGNLSGEGGGGTSEEGKYNHSHLQLRNGVGRVNFVDAFCRNTEE